MVAKFSSRMFIVNTKNETRLERPHLVQYLVIRHLLARVPLVGSELEQLRRTIQVARHAETTAVSKAKVMLRMCKALCCGLIEPTDRLHVIFLDILTKVITRADVALGDSSALISGELKPTDRLHVVLFNIFAPPVAETEVKLRTVIALFGHEPIFAGPSRPPPRRTGQRKCRRRSEPQAWYGYHAK